MAERWCGQEPKVDYSQEDWHFYCSFCSTSNVRRGSLISSFIRQNSSVWKEQTNSSNDEPECWLCGLQYSIHVSCIHPNEQLLKSLIKICVQKHRTTKHKEFVTSGWGNLLSEPPVIETTSKSCIRSCKARTTITFAAAECTMLGFLWPVYVINIITKYHSKAREFTTVPRAILLAAIISSTQSCHKELASFRQTV